MIQTPVRDSISPKRKRLYYSLLIPAVCSMAKRKQEDIYESTGIY